jgi:type II secretory pathway pseudopilin PulG
MTPRPKRPQAGSAGIGLTELLIALTVMSLVLVAVFSTFFRSQKVGQTMSNAVNLRQGARAANQLLERELRMAGSGIKRLEVDYYNSSNPSNTDSIFSIKFGPGAGSCDSVTILGGWTVATNVDTTSPYNQMPYPWSSIQVLDVSGFSVGDLVVITNGASAHLFQVTGIQTGAHPSLLKATSSAWNPPSGINPTLSNWPSGGYPAMTPVYKVSWVTYRMDSTTYRKPVLVRSERGGTPQLIAYNIAGFQIRYQMQDGSVTRSPTNIHMIDEVIPVIWTRQSVPGRPVQIDSVWADVRPRTF